MRPSTHEGKICQCNLNYRYDSYVNRCVPLQNPYHSVSNESSCISCTHNNHKLLDQSSKCTCISSCPPSPNFQCKIMFKLSILSSPIRNSFQWESKAWRFWFSSSSLPLSILSGRLWVLQQSLISQVDCFLSSYFHGSLFHLHFINSCFSECYSLTKLAQRVLRSL